MNAIATFVTIMLPMTFKLAVDIIFWTLWKTKRTAKKPKWTFHLYFPLLTIHQNCQMVWRLALLLREKEQWMNDLEDFNKDTNKDQWDQMKQLHLPEAGSSRGNLIRMTKDGMEKLINKLREHKDYQNSYYQNLLNKLLSNLPLFESCLDTNKSATKTDAIQQLIEVSLKSKLNEITEHQLEMATFNVSEGLLEATPQALLQSSIQMRDGKFFNLKHPMEMITVILSIMSMSFAAGTM